MCGYKYSTEILDTTFIYHGVYLFKNDYDYLFVCETCGDVASIGKLVQYQKQTNTMYEKTSISYFLNCYKENDIKSLFLSRDNYELVGFVEGSKRSIRGKEHNSGSDKKDNDTDIKYNFMFSNEGSKKYLLKKERKV